MTDAPSNPVTAQVRVLETMTLEEVRSAWRARYGAPPKLRSLDLLRRLLSWRMQIEATGGLDPALRQALRAGDATPRGPTLRPGAKVGREWRGVRHEVEVIEAGFLYEGRTYDSLSSIARAITGVRWNGPRFFGLRAKEPA